MININKWPKPRKTIYNQHDVIKKGGGDMQVLSMLGLSGDDIARLEVALKAMAETPSKIDALIARIDKLEEAINGKGTGTIDGGTFTELEFNAEHGDKLEEAINGKGTGTIDGGTFTELEFNAEHGTAIDESGSITKF